MQIRLSVTTPRPARSGPEPAMSASRPVADLAIDCAAGTAFSAVATTLRNLAGLGPAEQFFAGLDPVPDTAVLGLGALLDGTLLTAGRPGPSGLPATGLELHVTGGPDAGGVHVLTPPRAGREPMAVTIGRGPDAAIRIDDPDLSRLHAELLITADWVQLRDRGSTNGTTVDAAPVGAEPVLLPLDSLVRLGETGLVLRMGAGRLDCEADRLGHLRVRTLRRPGRAPAAVHIELPPRPINKGLPAARRRALLEFDQAKAVAETRIAAALAAEGEARSEQCPDPAALLTLALRPGPGLWARERTAPDLLTLRLGTARIGSQVTVTAQAGGQGATPDSSQARTFRPRLPSAPVTVDLAEAGVLGLVGARPALDGLARALVAQLAALCAPSDLELVLLAPGGSGQWEWLRWLPHLFPQDGQDCRVLVGHDALQTSMRLTELVGRIAAREAEARATGRAPGRWSGRRTVVVFDPAADLLDERGAQRVLCDGPDVGIYSLVLGARPHELPDATGAMAVIGGEVDTRLRLERPDQPLVDGVIADQVSTAWAERLGRALAPLREADGFEAVPALPEEVRLLALLDLDLLTPAKLTARWAAEPHSSTLAFTADDHGPVRIDLSAQHVLVGGAPGAGVSESIRSIVCGLAAVNRPEYLRIALVSDRSAASAGTGGPASLSPCAALPHVDVHLAADSPADSLRKLLDQIQHELKRRRDLQPPGARFLANPANPRMLVAVDSLEQFGGDHPWFVRALGDLAREGRDLGLNVAVGITLDTTQSLRLLEEDLCDGAQVRLALRTHGPAESRRLISLPLSAALRPDTPGRGHLALPDGRVLPVQRARISGRMASSAAARATVTRLPWAELGSPPVRRSADGSTAPGASGTVSPTGPTDLALLAETISRATTRSVA
ncbi:MAG TPA: FHA domain-containing protein [Actinocrinis sp.]|nr:FHA domain-containing protein [Actinocrinis sp.]